MMQTLTIDHLKAKLFETSKHGLRPSAKRIAAASNKELLAALVDATNSLPQDATVVERIYALANNISTRPACATCNGPLHPGAISRFKYSTGYTTFCSAACAKRNTVTAAKHKTTSLSRYGVAHPFQAKEVKQKIAETNNIRYGSSTSLAAPHVVKARMEALAAYHNDQHKLRLASLKRIGERAYIDYTVEANEELFIAELKMRFTHNPCNTTFDARLLNGELPRCPHCYPKKSNVTKPHEMLVELLKAEKLIENSRSVLLPSKKEVDIYLPKHKVAIEVNGLYWHSFLTEERTLVQLTKDYHLTKTKLAEDLGLTMLHVWEHEAANPIMHDLILSKLNKLPRVGARQTEACNITHDEAKQFLTVNHLQGSTNCSYQVGLKLSGELVAVMTFGKPRFNKHYQWELLRLAFKRGLAITGGASKMLAKFKRDCSPSSLLSYAERRLGLGTVYKTLGFKLSYYSEPGYFYWRQVGDHIAIVSRYMAQKHKLPKLLGKQFDEAKTEQANMLAAGYGLVYDCGQAVYTIDKM